MWQAEVRIDLDALLTRALEGCRRVLGEDHPDTLTVLNNLALLYQAAGRYADAGPLLQQLLDQQKKKYGPGSVATAGPLALIGYNLLQQKKYAEAEPPLRECVQICEKKAPDDWARFNAQSQLGGSLLGQKKYADAEPLLLAGYAGLNDREAKIPAANKVRLREAIERLVRLYEATAQADKAAGWRQMLEARREAGKKSENPEKK